MAVVRKKAFRSEGFFLFGSRRFRLYQRSDYSDKENAEGYAQRMGGVNVHANVRQKDFRADENQNDSQRGFEVDEAVDGGGQEKIERPQAENGKDVAGVNDEYVLSNQENCRNAVNSIINRAKNSGVIKCLPLR